MCSCRNEIHDIVIGRRQELDIRFDGAGILGDADIDGSGACHLGEIQRRELHPEWRWYYG